MSFADESGNGMVMPVSPMYGNNGSFGGDLGWIVLLLLFGRGGWGFGGFGGMALGYDFPWLLNGQNEINANVNSGFRDAQLNGAINGVQNAVTSGFGDVQTALCGGFAGVNATVNGAQNAIAQQMYTNQIADMERSFAAQTANTQGMNALQGQLAQCCCDNRAATADLKYTVASEECATRTANAANTQAILDKLCQLELDGYKRENDSLRTQLNMANLAASQTAQTAQILAGQTAEIDGVYNRLKNCPVPSMPVAGMTPLFQCNPSFSGNNAGCGCGCGNGGFVG